MLRTDLTDHRGTDDASLVRAVADGDAIALAEAYHRTITAAHACARRLLASPVEIEALLRSVYTELWEEPPIDEALEGWVRSRCFTLGTGYLRQHGLPATSRSLASWTSGVDGDEREGGNDALERMIAELTTEQQAALVRAHDQGTRTAEHEDPEAGVALQHALLVLASPLTDDERHAAEMCSSGVALANWIFGLLPPHEAATVPGTAAEPTPCGRLANVLRRARRRFEPLPPTPDLGHRVLAWVLSSSSSGNGGGGMHASSLDTELRVASADLDRAGDRGAGAPRSSLDMTVPTPTAAEAEQQPVTSLRGDETSASPAGWARPDVGEGSRSTGSDRPTPLRSPGGPPALAGSNAPPLAFGNAAPALAPDFIDEDGEELVRMPLHAPRRRRTTLSPTEDRDRSARRPDEGDDTQTVQAAPGQDEGDDTQTIQAAPDEVVPPPAALWRRGGDETAPPALRSPIDDDTRPPSTRRSEPAPGALGSPVRSPLDDDTATAPSPLSAEEQRGALTERDLRAGSPLQRPSPASGGPGGTSDFDTQPHTPFDRTDGPGERMPPRRRRQSERSVRQARDQDATVPTPVQGDAPAPIQRDDSDPRLDDLFGAGAGHGSDPGPPPALSGSQAANMTAPTLPAARRPTPPSSPPGSQRPGGSATQGRPSQPSGSRTAPSTPVGPPVSHVEPDSGGGNSILRWLVVILLIAAGAAVGIFLGQMLI